MPESPVPSYESSSPADETTVVVTGNATLRDREDGTYERDGVSLVRRRRRPIDPVAVGATLILLLFAGAAATWWLVTRDETRSVPSVEGLSADRAVTSLHAEGFEARLERRSNGAARDTVIDQSPTPGDKADKGSSVQVIVSSGPATIAVPNAVGLAETEARDRLVASGFQVASRHVFAERDTGTVVSQSPAAGARADKGARVELVVSKGSGLVEVPNLVGLPRAEAESRLSTARLAANVVEVPSAEPVGTVVAQNPPGGQLRQGKAVRLNVSRGS